MSSVATSPSPKPTIHRPESDNANELFARWQQHGDEAAREALVRRYLPLANRLARRYLRSSEPFEDLRQVASLGLLKALDRFDPSRGRPFQSFAVPTMLGEMRRYFRDSGWSVHVPARCAGARAEGARRPGGFRQRARPRTDGQPARRVSGAQRRGGDRRAGRHAGLQDAVAGRAAPGGEQDDTAMSYGDSLGEEDECYELVELDATVTPVLDHIPARERRILHMRFVDDLTQTEIAARMGISQMQVSRLLRRSLERAACPDRRAAVG